MSYIANIFQRPSNQNDVEKIHTRTHHERDVICCYGNVKISISNMSLKAEKTLFGPNFKHVSSFPSHFVYSVMKCTLHKGQWSFERVFYAPVTIVRGALRFAPVCPSVRPSVRHALWYRVCVINSSHSFKWIFLKPCIPVVDILKMCMWVFGGARIYFDRITAFRT